MAEVLRTQQFDPVLGRIGFDQHGHVYGYEPFVWYIWQAEIRAAGVGGG